MATRRIEISTHATVDAVWQAARDVGALHTRLVPGFVVDTKLEPGARVVTFANGLVVREPIVAIDDEAKRLVWTSEGGRARHYNASLQAFPRARAAEPASSGSPIFCPTRSRRSSRRR